MCGICGIFNYKINDPAQQGVVKKMADAIMHRGPDDEGYYSGFAANGIERLCFGMRRLSIIDLSTGHQPISNEDKSVWVVFNGEIYNFLELKEELLKKGHNFRTHSDTEVIAHMYEEYGKDCVKYFRGMFAIAIADEKKKTLLLARDRVGKKPLYFTKQGGTLIFGSEIKAILEYPGLKRTINLDAINLFLTYQYIPSPITIFNEIKRLPPASVLTCSIDGEIQYERYWDLDFTQKTNLSFDDACLRIREILTEATKLRLIADVPLGAFLSGGHDSSIIVALMSQLSKEPVKTFSIGFEDQDFSELKYAKIIADYYKTDHHELIVKPHFKEILPRIVWHYDQPYADSSALPTYYVSNITRPHVKVALNGDGGDENFAGYLRHQAMKGSVYFSPPFRLLGKGLTLKLTSMLPLVESTRSKSGLKYMNRFFSAMYETPERRDVLWHAFFKNETKYRIYSEDMMQKVGNNDAYNYLADVFVNSPAKGILDKTLYTDIMTYLPECLCVKMDVASMANSLETRSPLLDHKLFEFTSTLPPNWKLKGLFNRKYIMKETFRKDLPPEILNRGKQGFGSPVGKWFRSEWKDYFREVALSNKAMKRGYFKRTEVEGLFNEHTSGRKDNGYCLYALLMLELWHNVFIDK